MMSARGSFPMNDDLDPLPVDSDLAPFPDVVPLPPRSDPPPAVMPFTQELTLGPTRRRSAARTGPLWHGPLNRSAHFTGRESILNELHPALQKRDALAHVHALG